MLGSIHPLPLGPPRWVLDRYAPLSPCRPRYGSWGGWGTRSLERWGLVPMPTQELNPFRSGGLLAGVLSRLQLWLRTA